MRYLLFLISVFFLSCSNQPTADGVREQITAQEAAIGANPNATEEELRGLLKNYETYADLPDADSQQVVDYYLRAGDMATRLKDFDKTLGYYEFILAEYPHNPKAAKAMFMKGFTLDNKLGRLDEAKAVYEEFLATYPDDDFANDAEFSLKNLGKSAEEIIKEFEEKQGKE
jgi:tetratricopeptide (TPR) repeat protein